MVPLIDLKIQHKSIASEVEAAIKNVCDNTAFILSDEMKAFETEFAAYCGANHGIGVANGTEALFLALRALGIGEGFQVWNCTTIDYGCKIGANVKIHCNCYVAQFTVVEDNAFMAPGVTIANDIHPGCLHSGECMRGPYIEEGVEIGVNVTILPFVRIGAHSLIGSGAVVVKDVPPESVVVGNPGRVICSIHELKCQSGLTEKPYGHLLHGS